MNVFLRHTIVVSVLLLALAASGWLNWLAFQPAQGALVLRRPLKLAPARPTLPEPPSATPRRSARVNLRRAGAPSVTALKEIDAGKFIVRTKFLRDNERQELYRQLGLRGGIWVVEDSRGHYWWLRTVSDREPLGGSVLALDTYALNRPRALPPGEERFTGGHRIGSEEQLFLVMPRVFEARILTEIESMLSEPLSAFVSANVTVGLTPNGYLEFALEAVEHRQRGAIHVGRQFRGL